MVHFDLSFTSSGISDVPAEVMTLRDSIFFPSPTMTASPILLYRQRLSSKDHELFLCLTYRQGPGEEKSKDKDKRMRPPSPVIIRWKIPHGDGWRVWDSTRDEQSDSLRCGFASRSLRGVFVDGDKRFHVPIRSGLNWTRKAFLSCA